MKPDIVEKPAFLVVGIRNVWDLNPQVLESLWQEKILPRRKEIKAAPGTENSAFGVFGPIPDNSEKLYEYVAGLMVPSLEDIPLGMVGWEIPAGIYAATTAQGLANVYPVYREVIDKWLPQSGYEAVNSPVFTISSNLEKPADPATYWQINVRIRNPRHKSEIEMWNLD